jgi:hypothetical protein
MHPPINHLSSRPELSFPEGKESGVEGPAVSSPFRLASKRTKLGTRTAGVLHVAAALELGVDVLYTFGLHQRKLPKPSASG